MGVVAAGGVQVVGQIVGDAVGVTQEPVEQVENFGDARELGGVDLRRRLGRGGWACRGRDAAVVDAQRIVISV